MGSGSDSLEATSSSQSVFEDGIAQTDSAVGGSSEVDLTVLKSKKQHTNISMETEEDTSMMGTVFETTDEMITENFDEDNMLHEELPQDDVLTTFIIPKKEQVIQTDNDDVFTGSTLQTREDHTMSSQTFQVLDDTGPVVDEGSIIQFMNDDNIFGASAMQNVMNGGN